MKEEEAKTKWCPMVMFARATGSPMNNRGEETSAKPKCIASDCMMWRKGRSYWVKNGVEVTSVDFEGISPESVGATTVQEGYCGLAGKY